VSERKTGNNLLVAQSPSVRWNLIRSLKKDLIEAYTSVSFVHHEWYVRYHLEIVEKIALELVEKYREADREVVLALVWLHDYGKTIDRRNQYQLTVTEGRKKLLAAGFEESFADLVVRYADLLDRKIDLPAAPIEVQIVSSADGCAHFVGPFFQLWWWENAHKPFHELMADNQRKALKDWNKKIVLPEACAAFESRFRVVMEQCGDMPDHFL
jgi:HD domain